MVIGLECPKGIFNPHLFPHFRFVPKENSKICILVLSFLGWAKGKKAFRCLFLFFLSKDVEEGLLLGNLFGAIHALRGVGGHHLDKNVRASLFAVSFSLAKETKKRLLAITFSPFLFSSFTICRRGKKGGGTPKYNIKLCEEKFVLQRIYIRMQFNTMNSH